MSLSIRVNGLNAHGVELLSPAHPEFDDLARPLIGERVAAVGLELKPMLTIVSNESGRTIVSLSVVWRVTHRNGTTSRYWGHASFPEAICGDAVSGGDATGLGTGQRRVEANGLVIHGWGNWDEYYDQFLGQFVDQKNAQLADAADLSIELNAVIFADGTLIGPDDDSALTDLFSTYVRAKQDWYRGIIASLDDGRSVADSFASVERFLAESAERRRAGMRFEPERPDQLWTGQAAADAARWRRRYGDADLPRRIRQAIRLDPFIVRRG